MTDIDRPAMDGELIDLPPEPPHDHIVNAGGYLFAWDDEFHKWQIQSDDVLYYDGWEEIQYLRPITVYAPIKEYK